MNWDYVAGFLDGEGSIIIKPPRVRLYISNTDLNVLIKLKEFMNYGRVYEIKRKNNHGWKRQYGWELGNHKSCLKVLKKLKNKLIIKREKCAEAISYIENKRWQGDYLSKNELKKFKNLSYRKIAKKLGVSHFSVFKYQKKYGLR